MSASSTSGEHAEGARRLIDQDQDR